MTTITGELTMYFAPGASMDASCPLCDNTAYAPTMFAVVTTDCEPLCEDCVNKHLTPGTWEFCEALDKLDTALMYASPEHRAGMLATALECLKTLGEAWSETANEDAPDPCPGPECTGCPRHLPGPPLDGPSHLQVVQDAASEGNS